MKCNLKGLLTNVISDRRKNMDDYYSFCLEELLDHLQQVVNGVHTIEEFADHYCLKKEGLK